MHCLFSSGQGLVQEGLLWRGGDDAGVCNELLFLCTVHSLQQVLFFFFFSLLCFGKISSIVELCIVQEKGLRLSSLKGLCLSQSELQPGVLVTSVAV